MNRPKPKARCHPVFPAYALGLCRTCYNRDAQRLWRLRQRRLQSNPSKTEGDKNGASLFGVSQTLLSA